jgi:hypothetical protein
MNDHLKLANRDELLRVIQGQEQMILALRAELDALRAENEALRNQLTALLSAGDGDGRAPAVPVERPKRLRRERQAGGGRQKRAQGYGRRRGTPTRRVVHALEQCQHCGCAMRGGSIKRTREVLHIPLVAVEVIEHVFIERRCPCCARRQTPGAEVLAGEVIGRHRVSVQTMALIVTLHEECRLPVGIVQWMLQAIFGLELSQGELVAILHTAGQRGRETVTRILDGIRASPVVHADETFWREDGVTGYFWSFSTPRLSYLAYRHSRGGQMVTDTLGPSYHGTLVSDFYSAYSRHLGPHQRCWVHLLRDIHELEEKYPEDEAVAVWATAVHALYLEAVHYAEHHRERPWVERLRAKEAFEGRLMALCTPFLEPTAPQRVLCQRAARFLTQLFYFVVDERVPADNNAAERAVRPLAVCRKISGGTRSPQGSETKGILATLFSTWRLQGLNPLHSCRQMLLSP